MAVWQNMLDIAALNSWICFKKVTGNDLNRKEFVLLLAKELRKEYTCCKNIPTTVTLRDYNVSHRNRQKC